jgi:hypothetical protein
LLSSHHNLSTNNYFFFVRRISALCKLSGPLPGHHKKNKVSLPYLSYFSEPTSAASWFTKTFSVKPNNLNSNAQLISLNTQCHRYISIKFGMDSLLTNILIVITHGSAEVRTADKAGIDQ